MKALIIDDDKTVGFFLGKIFNEFNIESHQELNGENGLNEFMGAFENENPYNVVFLDVYMPDYNGIEILQAIREFESENNLNKTCVVMLTASSNIGIALSSKKFGAEKYIHKDSDIKQQIYNLIKEKGVKNEVW